MKKTLYLLTLGLIFSCSNNIKADSNVLKSPVPTPTASALVIKDNETKFDLKIGEKTKIYEDYYVKIDSLVSDSRCPANAQCIWAGEAKFNFVLFKNDQEIEKFTLSTIPNQDEKVFEKFAIKMTNVSNDKSNYVVKIEVNNKTITTSKLAEVLIKPDRIIYSNAMSSTVGIGLEPNYNLNRSPESINFTWSTNYGHFVGWDAPDFKVNELTKEVTLNSLKKIYWTYSPDEVIPNDPVKITLTLKDKTSNEIITSSFLELVKDGMGFKVK